MSPISKRLSAVLFALVMLSAPLAAQPTPQRPPAPAAQDGFVPVDAPMNAQDTMPAPRLVAIAYGFIWLVMFGYLWSIRVRLAKVEREMDAVGRRVRAGGK